MDKIIVKDLEVYAHHGVYPEETKLGQKFILSIVAFLPLRAAGATDDLTKSVSYGELCRTAEKILLEKNYALLEACAEAVAEKLLLTYDILQEVKIELKKPWAPIGCHLAYAAVEITRGWHRVYLGLGSNMGDKEEHLNQAIASLNTPVTKVIKVSSYHTTAPVGYLEQDDFLNCAVEMNTLLSPSELMDMALSIEARLKRERTIHWGPRTIDIDILLYDNQISDDEHILLPHPQMHKRLFVLQPLSEIAPYAIHPLLLKTILSLKEELE